MKILLIGKTGQLGGDLIKNNTGHEIYAPGRELIEISSPETVSSAINYFNPDILINTAAFHNLPACEQDPCKAFSINCIAVRNMALQCRQQGIIFLTFSTDYVFGGEKSVPYVEEDKLSPLQIYGISRAAGEYAVMAVAHDSSIIVRTCGLYGVFGARSKGGNFVDQRLKDAAEHKVIEIGCDQIVSPTYTGDLSRAIYRLIEHPGCKYGIYHLVNKGQCSWYEFTKAIYKIKGLNVDLQPVDRLGRSGEMRRPLYSVLANTKASALGIDLPHWRVGLGEYIQEKYGKQ